VPLQGTAEPISRPGRERCSHGRPRPRFLQRGRSCTPPTAGKRSTTPRRRGRLTLEEQAFSMRCPTATKARAEDQRAPPQHSAVLRERRTGSAPSLRKRFEKVRATENVQKYGGDSRSRSGRACDAAGPARNHCHRGRKTPEREGKLALREGRVATGSENPDEAPDRAPKTRFVFTSSSASRLDAMHQRKVPGKGRTGRHLANPAARRGAIFADRAS